MNAIFVFVLVVLFAAAINVAATGVLNVDGLSNKLTVVVGNKINNLGKKESTNVQFRKIRSEQVAVVSSVIKDSLSPGTLGSLCIFGGLLAHLAFGSV